MSQPEERKEEEEEEEVVQEPGFAFVQGRDRVWDEGLAQAAVWSALQKQQSRRGAAGAKSKLYATIVDMLRAAHRANHSIARLAEQLESPEAKTAAVEAEQAYSLALKTLNMFFVAVARQGGEQHEEEDEGEDEKEDEEVAATVKSEAEELGSAAEVEEDEGRGGKGRAAEPARRPSEEIRTILRIQLNGNWSALEMASMFSLLNELYCLHLLRRGDAIRSFGRSFLELTRPRIGVDFLTELASSSTGLEARQLRVRQIHYGSPGFADLAGLGAIIGHIKDFVLRIIEIALSRFPTAAAIENSNLDREAKRRMNDKLELENQREMAVVVAKQVEALRAAGFDRKEIRRLVKFAVEGRAETIFELVAARKITGITTFTSEDAPPPGPDPMPPKRPPKRRRDS